MSRFQRRPAVPLCAPFVALLVGCSSTGPGTLIVALDGIDDVTTLVNIQISGTITRTPSATTSLFVTISGGVVAVTDTAAETGRFTVDVPLRLDQLNTLTVTPEDGTGSAGQAVTVLVLQDGTGPLVAMMTPSGDAIATMPGPVEVRMDGPVVLSGAGAGMALRSGKLTVPGTTVLSTDSMTFTFTPSAPLPENSIFAPFFTGVSDAAGNPAQVGTNACFVTVATVPAMDVFADSTVDDVLGLVAAGGPSPTFIDPADMDQIRTAIQDSVLSMVVRFTSDRSFTQVDPNNTALLVEFDIDQDSTTGVRSIRDSLMIQVGAPELTSGIRPEYVVLVDHFPQLADSSAIGEYTSFNNFTILEAFWPQFCGPFVGFRVATALLGDEDGDFDVSLFALNLEGTGLTDPLIVDSAPDSGAYSVTYQGMFVPPMGVAPVHTTSRGVGSFRIPMLRSRR